MTLVFGSFLAGSLLTLLIPIALLIGIAAWHFRSFTHIPYEPGETVPHAAGVAEKEGLGAVPQDPPSEGPNS